MKYKCIFLFLFSLLTIFKNNVSAQDVRKLSGNITLGYNRNIETYFIAERLAVQHINTFVFDQKDSLYAHQPLVYFAYQHFRKYADNPCIIRIAALLASLRDRYHDNAEILQYLLSQKAFPARGSEYPFADTAIFRLSEFPTTISDVKELTDSLRSFYLLAKVNIFFNSNRAFYEGALDEAQKDIKVKAFPFMEKYYGEKYYQYAIYIMPMMPITVGDDNYRAFGPTRHLPMGRVSTMVFSSSRMIPLKATLQKYTQFGFNNPEVTRFLTVHEIGHSFVNPHVLPMREELDHDTSLFTPSLHKLLEPSYIDGWWTCVVEHLVRLGEIRIALAMNDTAQVNRLRTLHIKGFKFVLLPMLEKKIEVYEANRDKYPDFNSFLPEIFALFHSLTPNDIDSLVAAASTK